MRIRTQLIVAVSLSLAAALGAAVAVWFVAQRVAAIDESQSRVRAVARDISGLLALTQEYALYGSERSAQQWKLRHAQIVAALKPVSADSAATYPQLAQLRRDLDSLPELFANLEASLQGGSNAIAARRKEMLVDLLIASAQSNAEDAYRIQQAGASARTDALRQLIFAAVLIPLVLALAFVLLALLVSRRVMVPLARLQRIAATVRQGNLHVRMNSVRQDEIGDLSREFDAMTASLEFETESLERANDILREVAAQREASEKRLRLIGDNVPALIAYINPMKCFEFGNRAYEKAYGVPADRIVGMRAVDVLGPEAFAQSRPHIMRALGGERASFERTVTRNGVTRYERVTYIPELTVSGEVSGFFSLAEDITELKRIQLTLAESEKRIRVMADNIPALVAYIDRDERYGFSNAYMGKVFGIDPASMLGRTVREVRSEELYASIKQQIGAALRGERVNFENSVTINGRTQYFQVDFIPDFGADGSARGFYSMSFDVTALKEAEQQLRTVMESSPLGIYVTDANGKCLYANSAWQRMAGVSTAASLDYDWRNTVHPADREQVLKAWAAAARGDREFISEHRFQCADGTFFWARVNIAAMRVAGRISGYVGMVEDISQKHALDAALEQKAEELARSNSELEQFAYVASHDLQEPLRMVTSYTQLLRKRYSRNFDGDASEFMEFIVEGGQRMQALITDLLDLSRVNTSRRAFEPVPFGPVLNDALAVLKMRIAETGAEITRDALPTVSGDARQLGQVMLNLIGNALKFSGKEAPRIHIGAQAEGAQWHFTVADNGIGIDARFFERIFVIFQRLHTRSEYAGTGIGLAICKKIIERHGGRIWVESKVGEVGSGTTFHFTLTAATLPDVANQQHPQANQKTA